MISKEIPKYCTYCGKKLLNRYGITPNKVTTIKYNAYTGKKEEVVQYVVGLYCAEPRKMTVENTTYAFYHDSHPDMEVKKDFKL